MLRKMEFLAEIVLPFAGEIVLQAMLQLLAELGAHSLAEPFRPRPNPALAALGFALWGAAAGALSLWIFPHSALHDPLYRRINLLATPLAIAGLMTLVGRVRLGKGQALVRLDRFGYAFVFAFAMALVRFVWAG
jgi:hypothetical protein